MDVRIGSLCSGYGGLDHAVQAVLDADLAWVADPDPGASRILAHHHPDTPNLGDITTLAWSTVPQVDILTGGYPCQPFSDAGLRKGTDDERHIWPHIADALCVLRPRLAVFENVRGHLRRGFDVVLADLARFGFDASWVCVRASDVGAPHRRERLFVIAWPKGEIPYFPRTGATGGAGGVVPGGVTLLPTPRTSDTNGPGVHGEGGLDLRTAVSLLPTPRASDGAHGGPNQRGSKGDLMLSAAVQPDRFGEYAAAVARWGPIIGRQAPAPTDPTGKNGRGQLAPRFTEWLMGLPAGHVTAPEVGLTRTQQLHALGNGVVPQQGAMALRMLLERVTADVAA